MLEIENGSKVPERVMRELELKKFKMLDLDWFGVNYINIGVGVIYRIFYVAFIRILKC